MSSESSPTSLLYPYVAGGDNGEGQEEEEEDIIFCSKENVNEAAIYINQELELLGIGNIMVDGGATPDIVNMMNSTYQLLDMYRNTLKRLDDLGTNLQKTRSNLTLHSETISRLKAELEGSERRVKEHQEKERQVGLRNKSLTVQLKVKEEECRKIKLNMNHKEQQYLHDMKKREREYYRINERLGQFVLDKSHERKLGIKMLNNLQKSNLSSDVVKKEETMYQLVINHYEERQKELMLENTSLRESLSNIERELVAMLNQQDHSFTSNDKENSPPDTSVSSADHKDDRLLSSAHYQMPFDISRPNIERSLQDKCKSLKEHIKTLKGGRGGGGRNDKREGYEREIEELEKKLGDYKYIINQHEAMIEQQLQEGKTEAALVHLNESHYLKRMELLEMKEEKVRHREDQIRDEEIRLNMLAKILDREVCV
jgi:X breakpoint 2-interacting protein